MASPAACCDQGGTHRPHTQVTFWRGCALSTTPRLWRGFGSISARRLTMRTMSKQEAVYIHEIYVQQKLTANKVDKRWQRRQPRLLTRRRWPNGRSIPPTGLLAHQVSPTEKVSTHRSAQLRVACAITCPTTAKHLAVGMTMMARTNNCH